MQVSAVSIPASATSASTGGQNEREASSPKDSSPASEQSAQRMLPAARLGNITVHGSPVKKAGVWYAVKLADGRYLRIGRIEYLIAAALDGRRTAADVVEHIAADNLHHNLSEQRVLEVAARLAQCGLVDASSTANHSAVNSGAIEPDPTAPAAMRRSAKQTATSVLKSLNPVYTKITLISGQRLELLASRLTPLASLPMLLAAALLCLLAAAQVAMNWKQFASTTGSLFVVDGLLWWAAAWLVLKAAHELGHAVMAIRVGSRIRSAGISLIFLTPIPFVDLSDLWTIPDRWKRILCCGGGMLAELALSAVAALVALATDNESLRYFCCAVASMGTVTTLAFNASPFVRFDGYFIVSDLLNYPNLYTEAQQATAALLGRILRPWSPDSRLRAASRRFAPALIVYGLACLQYRVLLMLTLALGTILAFEGVGLLLVAWGGYAVLIGPRLKARRARAHRQPAAPTALLDAAQAESRQAGLARRAVAILWTAAVVAAVAALLFAPAPIQPSVPGFIALHEPQTIRSQTDGFLAQVLVEPQSRVAKGQLLAVLENPELELEIAIKRNEVEASQERIRLARAQGRLAELQAQEAQYASLKTQLAQLEQRALGLEIRSPRSGRLLECHLQKRLGQFLKAGDSLAMVAEPQRYEVRALVSQERVQSLRDYIGQSLHVKVLGGAGFVAHLEKVDPRGSEKLLEPLLAAIYGGPLPVRLEQSEDTQQELRLLAPRFALHAPVDASAAANVVPGQLVWLRVPGPSANIWQSIQHWWLGKWRELLDHARVSSE